MNCNPKRSMLLAALIAVGYGVVGAATYTEVGDAGQTPSFAQGVALVGAVETLAGRIEHAFDVDLFHIAITDPSAFSAAAMPTADAAPDLQLFLFDDQGLGVACNDDWLLSPLPQIPAGTLVGRRPRTYLLGVSPADGDPIGMFGEIFPDWEAGVSMPTGLSRIDPLLGWNRDFTAVGGDYSIALLGASGLVAPLGADFDEDGDVDGADLGRWRLGFGALDGATHDQGDADGDRDVDGADLLVWQRQLGIAATAASSGAVPEPSNWLLTILAPTGASLARRRQFATHVSELTAE